MTGSEFDDLFPAPLQRWRRWPISRDQVMLLMAAVGQLALGLETYLAHSISGTIVAAERIPIFFGVAAGMILLIAGLIAIRHRPFATILATVTLVASIVVGFMGAYYHFRRAALPGAMPGERISLDLLVWAPPILGPMVFSLIGLMGISAAWREDSPDSGVLMLGGGHKLRLPYSKTRAYLLMVGMGILAALVSSVLDHARTGFNSGWVWLPTGVAVFALVSSVALGLHPKPTKADMVTFIVAMLVLIAVGPIGSWLHVEQNLVANNTIVIERFLRGPPFLAPLLFSNMGLLGLAVLVEPERHDT